MFHKGKTLQSFLLNFPMSNITIFVGDCMAVRQVRKGKGVKKGSRPERILILSLSLVDSQCFYLPVTTSVPYSLTAVFMVINKSGS